MFSKILVPTDLSEKSIRSLEIAINMVEGNDGNVTLLHVVETIEDDEGEFDDFYDRLGRRAREKMKKIIKQCNPVNVGVREEIIYGNRVRQIVQFAVKQEIDLIVLSSHRIEDMTQGGGWATISYRVSILAPCPVMMVK